MSDYQSMFAPEDSFLAFQYRNFDFVVPLADVTRVAQEPPEDASVIGDGSGRGASCYLLSSIGDKWLAISADDVSGVIKIPTNRQHAMPQEAKSPGNEWIFGVADMGEGRRPAFLLDCRVMHRQLEEGSDS